MGEASKDGASWWRNARWRRVVPWLVAAVLVLPSLCWVSLNKSIWCWDQAWYGETSIKLYMTLRHEPAAWPAAMMNTLRDRAPGICWFGQFFVPLSRLTGNVDVALLLSILLAQLGTLVFMWKIGRRLAPEHSAPAVVGSLLVAAAPLFVALSGQYLVEPQQVLVIAWIYYLAVASASFTRLQAFAHLLAAAVLGMVIKTSTPMFCLLPGLIALYNVVPRRPGGERWGWRTVGGVVCVAASAALAVVIYRWYRKHWDLVVFHVHSASVGEDASYAGHKDELWKKLKFWIGNLQHNLGLPLPLRIVAVVFAGALLYRVVQLVRRVKGIRGGDLVALAALLHLGAVVLSCSLAIVEDVRYLIPALPSVAVLAMWAAAQLPGRVFGRVVGWGLAAALLLQFGYVQEVAFGWKPRTEVACNYLGPVQLDKANGRELDHLLDVLSQDERTAQRYSVVGVDTFAFNQVALDYRASKRELRTQRPILTTPVGYIQKDLNAGFQVVEATKAPFFISVAKDHLPGANEPDSYLNTVTAPLLERIAQDKHFVREPYDSKLGIVVYRRVAD